MSVPSGGDLIADVLVDAGVRTLFTVCGGHISPILVSSRARGIRVVDTRHEASAVFAADAEARLTGIPGAAAVTAGPGITNTVTPLKNAQMATSPIVVLCGATATVLKGRGALQDIDQEALLLPHVKWFGSAARVGDLPTLLREAFWRAQAGVPGPVCVECPVDLLYAEPIVRRLYGVEGEPARGVAQRAHHVYLRWHVSRLFSGVPETVTRPPSTRPGAPGVNRPPAGPPRPAPSRRDIDLVAGAVSRAQRPVLLIGSQAMLAPADASAFAGVVETLGVPTYLSGMARGLLGRSHPLQLRHRRTDALKAADLVVLAGVPCDFRLDYGRHIGARARVAALNRSKGDLGKNRHPSIAVAADADLVLAGVARRLAPRVADLRRRWSDWANLLRERDEGREREIAERAAQPGPHVNPLAFFRTLESLLPDSAVIVADGGDFVATASYVLRPRAPLSWLDPGVFGTLGVGGGFALGAKAARPEAETWVIWGDGAAGYSLAELDTCVRHGMPIIAVVGNDASWAQIAREQVEILGDATGTDLRRSDYHTVAEGLGAKGLLLERPEATGDVLCEAQRLARAGHPVLVNVILDRTDFRKGSISM